MDSGATMRSLPTPWDVAGSRHPTRRCAARATLVGLFWPETTRRSAGSRPPHRSARLSQPRRAPSGRPPQTNGILAIVADAGRNPLENDRGSSAPKRDCGEPRCDHYVSTTAAATIASWRSCRQQRRSRRVCGTASPSTNYGGSPWVCPMEMPRKQLCITRWPLALAASSGSTRSAILGRAMLADSAVGRAWCESQGRRRR